MRKRILYVMHVDWDWIKQRPHFLAEHLASTHNILVAYPLAGNRAALSKNSRGDLRIWPFLRLPFARKYFFIHCINRMLLRIYFRLVLALFRPHAIWVTFPELFDYLPQRLDAELIYDCMDDALGFDASSSRRALLLRLEQALIQKAAHVFSSSVRLREKLQSRASFNTKCTVVRNAFDATLAQSDEQAIPPIAKRTGVTTIGYIGTISEWVDLDALSACVQRHDKLEVHLLGPVDRLNPGPWQHDRIHFHGPIQHAALGRWAQCFDILILPFKVNELTQCVDPVKLYEYIFFDKPIIAVQYAEIERFSDFVSFYGNHAELLQALTTLIESGFEKKYSPADRQTFLEANSWDSRAMQIREFLP